MSPHHFQDLWDAIFPLWPRIWDSSDVTLVLPVPIERPQLLLEMLRAEVLEYGQGVTLDGIWWLWEGSGGTERDLVALGV